MAYRQAAFRLSVTKKKCKCPPCCVRSPAPNSIERWWQQLEAANKHPEDSGKVINALAMAASYDPEPTQFLGIRLPVTIDTCELLEERWANWSRQDPSPRSKARRTIFAG